MGKADDEQGRGERLERSKVLRRRLDSVAAHWVEGLTARQSAERLGVSARTVEYLLRFLQLTRGQAWRGGVAPMGRWCEVRP